MTECRASKVTTVPVRSSSGQKCVVSFVFAPISTWARVTTVPWVTAESRCRRVAVRRADPLSALPSTAITRDGPNPEGDEAWAGSVPVGQVGADRPVQGVTVNSPQHTADRGRAGVRRHLSRWRRIPIAVRSAVEARWPHSASSSMLLAPGDSRAGAHQQDRCE